MSLPHYTRDGFLGGKLVADQPRKGFRAGHDTVLLAAAVPATAQSTVLELGSGAGVASLCLAHRVPGTRVMGIEIDAELVQLANDNARLNSMADRVRFIEGDIVAAKIDEAAFDCVFLNPPFHPETGQVSPLVPLDRATRGDGLPIWVRRALENVKQGGSVTLIVRADRAADIEEAAMADTTSGGVALTRFPLIPRAGEAAKRVIVQIVKGTHKPAKTLAGLVLHEAGGRNSEAAEAILRHGGALTFA